MALSDLDYNRIILSFIEVGCRGQCASSFVAVPVGGDSGLEPGGSDGAGERPLHGFWIHSEGRPNRICW